MFWASDQLMGRFDVSVFWKILCFQTVKCLSQVLVVRNDLKMKSGKIASQCARKIPTVFFFFFLINFCLVLLVSLHSAENFLLARWLTISFMNLQMLPLACMQNWCTGIIVLIMSLFLVQSKLELCSSFYCMWHNFQASDCRLALLSPFFYILKSYFLLAATTIFCPFSPSLAIWLK